MSNSLQPHGLQHTRIPCLSITSSQSLFKLMSVESVMPFNHLILCYPLLLLPSILIFPSIRVFSNEPVLCIEVAEVLELQLQHQSFQWIFMTDFFFFLIWTCWISLQAKGPSRVISNNTVQKHQFSDTQFSLLSNSHIHTYLLEKLVLWLDRPLLVK